MPAIIDQILAQSQAGSANGAIIPGFAEGAKLAMERRKLDSDLQTEELQRSTMTEMAAFNRQMQVLKLEEARTNMKKLVGLQQANTDASKLVAWAVQEPSVLDTPEFQSHAAGVLGNPLVMSTDNGKTLFGMINSRRDHKAALAAGMVPTEQSVRDVDGSVTKYGPKILSPEEQQKQNLFFYGTSASGHPIYHPLSKGLTPEQLTKLGLKPDHTDKDGNVIWKTPMDPKLVAGRIKYMESMNQYMSLKGQALIAHASGQTEAQFLQTMVKSLAANPINAGKTPEQLSEMAKALYRNTKSDPMGLFENLPPGDPFGDETKPETPSGTDLEPRNE